MEELATEDHAAVDANKSPPIVAMTDHPSPKAAAAVDAHHAALPAPHPQQPAPLETSPININNSLSSLNTFRPSLPDAGFALPNTLSPPPTLPAHYNSILFPRLDPFKGCPSSELTAISQSYLEREKAAFRGTRLEGEFAKLYHSKHLGKPFCKWCSEFAMDPTPIWHRHFSSKMSRLAAPMDNLARYNCNQCSSSPHYAITGSRTRVILTSSTLHDHWGKKSGLDHPGDSLHLDVVSVPGAKIKDLTRAYKAEFSTHPLPLDVLCIVGYNDILNPCFYYGPDDEVEDLLEFVQLDVERASWELNRDARQLMSAVLSSGPQPQSNSCAFATLPVPPILAWKNFTNSPSARAENINNALKIQLLNRMNRDYRAINIEVQRSTGIETTRAPSFKAWGLKKKPSNQNSLRHDLLLHDNAMGPYACRLSHFREQNPKSKLHFSAQQKVKMGKACCRYFKALYSLEPSFGETKEEGLARQEALRTLPDYVATA